MSLCCCGYAGHDRFRSSELCPQTDSQSTHHTGATHSCAAAAMLIVVWCVLSCWLRVCVCVCVAGSESEVRLAGSQRASFVWSDAAGPVARGAGVWAGRILSAGAAAPGVGHGQSSRRHGRRTVPLRIHERLTRSTNRGKTGDQTTRQSLNRAPQTSRSSEALRLPLLGWASLPPSLPASLQPHGLERSFSALNADAARCGAWIGSIESCRLLLFVGFSLERHRPARPDAAGAAACDRSLHHPRMQLQPLTQHTTAFVNATPSTTKRGPRIRNTERAGRARVARSHTVNALARIGRDQWRLQ